METDGFILCHLVIGGRYLWVSEKVAQKKKLTPAFHSYAVATYILAPLPNALCARCAGEYDVMSDYNR